jgi:HTH-type transcriptional regulator, competence development regulator
MRQTFGSYIRKLRDEHRQESSEFSVRKVALRIGVEPSYLSKVERDEVAPPSEATILRLAKALGEDSDLLLALAGKVSSHLRAVILRRPKLFAELIRQLKDAPDNAVLRIAREVRDGHW